MAYCVPLGSTDFDCKEEVWYDANVNWLVLVEQNDYKEPLPTP